MKTRLKIILVLTVLGFVISCGNKKNKPEMYEPSELASTMKQMLKDYESAKNRLDEGQLILSPVDYHKKILTAEPTDSSDINDLYMSLGQTFIDQADRYAAVKDSLPHQVAMHNLTIKACINCHEHFCGGPITAIKKLFVVENL